MLPRLEGMIARRLLLNYRADPALVQRLIPKPLQVVVRKDAAVVGVCLIRLEHLRVKGLPPLVGMTAENMAHRVAVRFPIPEGWQDGVFIWRRHSNRCFMERLGGRLFPGVHERAGFKVMEWKHALAIAVQTKRHDADVEFAGDDTTVWQPTALFETPAEASRFFERGDCGLSCSLRGEALEGVRLRTLRWEMVPLVARSLHSTFYQGTGLFPQGSVEFDCALVMRGVPHEWVRLDHVPSMRAAVPS
jgi:hypothetical protein